MKKFRFVMVSIVGMILFSSSCFAGPLDRDSAQQRYNPAADSMLRVPGVVGMYEENARRRLQQVGLSVDVEYIRGKNKKLAGQEEMVISQIPDTGGVAMLGSAVLITVYKPAGTNGNTPGDEVEMPVNWGGNSQPSDGGGGWIPPQNPTKPVEPIVATPVNSTVTPVASHDESAKAFEAESEAARSESIVATSVQQTATMAPVGKKGKFRVTINGFRIFAVKGVLPRRGHTYYAAAKVIRYTQEGLFRSQETKSTKLIGHTKKFPGAIQGGTATKNGGFKNGDVYPGSPPYSNPRSAFTDRLPLKVWEGELQEGGDVVVIEPALWEKRNGNSIFRAWQDHVPPNIESLSPCVPRYWDNRVSSLSLTPKYSAQAPIDDLISGPYPPGYPESSLKSLRESPRICEEITSKALFRPSGSSEPDVIAGLTEKTFYRTDDDSYVKTNVAYPYGILLNYSLAEKMANETQTGPVYTVTYSRGGIPHGYATRNERRESSLPVGGFQIFMFSRVPADQKTLMISGANTAFVIPDTTVIELYVQVRRSSN